MLKMDEGGDDEEEVEMRLMMKMISLSLSLPAKERFAMRPFGQCMQHRRLWETAPLLPEP